MPPSVFLLRGLQQLGRVDQSKVKLAEKMKLITCLTLSILLMAHSAFASETSIKAAMENKFPYQKLISVNKTPYFGLYEVVFEDQLFYTDDKMSYLFSGSVIDLKTMTNLTEARERQLYTVKFDTMPLNLAMKRVNGNGKRRVAVFTDPSCSYCMKLEKEMIELNNATIYIFPLALLPGSDKQARAIWCAPNRLKAWEDHMLKGMTPARTAKCDTNALTEFAALAKNLRVYVTPTMIFEDGFTQAGWMERELIDQQLTESSPK